MSTIVTRAGKGSPLTHNEVDANFNNLNNDKVEESTTITAGTGLSGGGDLSANRTISLANTAVTPGSYGSASAVGTFTVDAQGRLTAASNTNIQTPNSVTFNNAGAGGASGSTFNGSGALTVSYNTIGAPSVSGTNATGTWGISISGNAATATTASNVNNGTLTMNVSGTGLSGSQTFTANQAGNATFTVASNATNLNTASTIVARDASGNFSAGTITATLNGNASTATTASNVNNGTLTMNVSGTGLSGSQTFTANQSGNATFTVTSNATSANTASAIVARDGSGNFSAGIVSVSQLNAGSTGARFDSAGDIYAIRTGGTTGVIFLGSSGTKYLFFDGTNYTMPSANLFVNGVQAVTNSGTWGISISGTAALATSIESTAQALGYSLSGQTIIYAGQGGPQIRSQGGGAAMMSFHRPGAFAANFGLDSDNQFALGGWSYGGALGNLKVGSFGVGTTASGTAGEIRATNNVTAYYSDARLKDFKGKINDALDKVSQLNGYYYTENAKAEEYGYNNKELQVGVSAQEVKAVLPEIIAPAPFDMDSENKSKSGENYMTVRYEKLVPLLIEAIKELKAEVEALKAAK